MEGKRSGLSDWAWKFAVITICELAFIGALRFGQTLGFVPLVLSSAEEKEIVDNYFEKSVEQGKQPQLTSHKRAK